MSRPTAQRQEQGVGCAHTFIPDELSGFEKTTLELPPEGDGELAATLVRTVGPAEDQRPAVLYVHGFVDYFFQEHVAAAFEQAGFRFYALDLRRHGRSLRDGNRACMAWRVEDYFKELDWAVEAIRQQHPRLASLVTHSTGGLIVANYLAAREDRSITSSFVTVSPFLRFNYYGIDLFQIRVLNRLARFLPSFPIPQRLNGVYGMVLHRSHGGEWDYDLEKKPLRGFPVYFGWFRMILAAQTNVERGLGLELPILSLHSDRSTVPGKVPVDDSRVTDTVLNVKHIKELSPKLGSEVTLVEIPGGVHDLTLSERPVRDKAIAAMVGFVKEHA